MKKYLLLLFTLMFAVSCSDDSSSSTPAPTPSKDPAQEIELIQRFNLDSYPADLSPFAPIPNNPIDADFAKIPSIKYGLVNETGKEYPNPTLELTAKNKDDEGKFTSDIYLGSYIPQLSYPVISIKSKSSKIEQIPLILTLKSEGIEVKKWEITLNSVYALQPTERIVNADGTIQYNGIDKKIEMKLNETKRIYFFNSTASTLKINKKEWKLTTDKFQLQDGTEKDKEGYSNCYVSSDVSASIPSSSACFIDVKHVGESHGKTQDQLVITPMIRDLSDTATFYKPSTIDFNYEVITSGN